MLQTFLMWVKKRSRYLLIIHNAWSDLRSLVARCAFNSQSPLMEGLSRDAIVRQLNIDRVLHLEDVISELKSQMKRQKQAFSVLFWCFNMKLLFCFLFTVFLIKGEQINQLRIQKQVYQKELSDFKMLHIFKVMDIEACS